MFRQLFNLGHSNQISKNRRNKKKNFSFWEPTYIVKSFNIIWCSTIKKEPCTLHTLQTTDEVFLKYAHPEGMEKRRQGWEPLQINMRGKRYKCFRRKSQTECDLAMKSPIGSVKNEFKAYIFSYLSR